MRNLLLATFSFLVLAINLSALPASAATIDDAKRQACIGAGGEYTGGQCVEAGGGGGSLEKTIKSITNVLVFIVGVASVILLIIGGLRYTLSGGDSGGVEGAKNTILFAIVGVIVAFMAYAIVNFVLGALNR